jgi:hypothetical protein
MIALLMGALRRMRASAAELAAFLDALAHDMRMTRAEIERQYGPLSE